MLLCGTCLRRARDGGRPAGSWGNGPGFTVLGSRSTSASLSSPQHPREGAATPAARRTQNMSPQHLGEGFSTAGTASPSL